MSVPLHSPTEGVLSALYKVPAIWDSCHALDETPFNYVPASAGALSLHLMWDSPKSQNHTRLTPVCLARENGPSHLQEGAGRGACLLQLMGLWLHRPSSARQALLGPLLGQGLELFTR